MSYSISRLTLFAVIGAIETDLREICSNQFGLRTDLENVLGSNLAKQALDRYEKDFGPSVNPPTVAQLLVYLDFADSYAVINANTSSIMSTGKYIRSNTVLLEKLVPVRNRVMHSRPLLFDDFSVTLDIAEKLAASQEHSWNNLKSTLIRLREEPSFVLNLEIPSYFEDKRKHNLPIPDFDETGFLGRKQQAAELRKHILGPYPVISLVGDGGIGKTALVLKVAYDILDMPDCPFEAIVWTSSKTTQLTAQEIRRIEGAISDSLGIFKNIANELAGSVENPMDEVVEYLKEFRILLIIDNLETVLDEKIRQFLEILPLGSKVLITSRIGIGAFEYPQKLQAMDKADAVDLLRALAKTRGVTDLVKLDNAKLANYCQRMKFSPGFIKWFVSAVQAGKRPEEVLSKPDIFLDFCMSNVYNYLSAQGKTVLRSMLVLPGKHSLAELAFLNEIEAIDLQAVIYELLRTNMVIMSSTSKGSSFESQYEISDLARTYLTRLYPPDPREFEKINKRKRQLVAAGEEFQAAQKTDPYSRYSLTIRSRSDFIFAKYLVDALKQSQEKNFSAAEAFIQKARDLAPEYFEIYRVDAIIKTAQGNYSAAHAAYEAAIEIEPLSAPLRKWYGDFLMKYIYDTDKSLAQYRIAAELDPDSIEVQLEIVRALLYLKDFDQATEKTLKLIGNVDARTHIAVKTYDLYLQCFYRRADYLLSEHQYADAIIYLGKLQEAYEACPLSLRDKRMRQKLTSAHFLAKRCFQLSYDEDANLTANARGLARWFAQQAGSNGLVLDVEDQEYEHGTIVRIPQGQDYGFIGTDNGNEYFFHFNSIRAPQNTVPRIGDKAKFVIGTNRQGPCAIEVIIK